MRFVPGWSFNGGGGQHPFSGSGIRKKGVMHTKQTAAKSTGGKPPKFGKKLLDRANRH